MTTERYFAEGALVAPVAPGRGRWSRFGRLSRCSRKANVKIIYLKCQFFFKKACVIFKKACVFF